MTKSIERAEARHLRGEGMSVKDIALQLGVAKASVSVWVRDIALTDAQSATLRDKYHHYDAKLKAAGRI
jgi:predicted transcriptional regulator